MKNFCIRSIFVAIAFLNFCTLQAQQKELVDKIVARVGDEFILMSDVEEQYATTKDQRGTVPENYRCMVMDQMLVAKLLYNQAKIDSLYPKDEEIESQLTARFDKILDYMNGNTEQFINYYGQTPTAMKAQMREDMKEQIMTDKMRAKVITDIAVTPSEVKVFFEKINKDSLPYFNQEVEISEIIRKPRHNAEQKAIARQKLQAMRDSVINGKADFADLAKKFSADPGSGREGGDLGFAKRGKFVPEFEAQAYKLNEGEYSQVFETEFGFHLLQLIERRGNTVHTRHILIRPQFVDADFTDAKKILDSVRLLVIKDSMTFSYAVKQYGEKNVPSYHNDGRLTNAQLGTNTFETRDLDPDTYFSIDSMKAGSISRPIEVTGAGGEKYYRLVKLLSKTSPHKASLATDYNKIQSATTEQKKGQELVKWIDAHNKKTYIIIESDFKNCPNLQKWQNQKRT